jgi:NADH-quinone oxidoreductase subunit M
VAPLLLMLALLISRTGTDDITRMGGLALRAPVLAGLFLIVTLALLAMPGSANFIGEFFILNGVFQEKIAFAIVASLGVAMAAFYALRLYQLSMHNRLPPGTESSEVPVREGTILAALVTCIVALSLYPGLVLERTDKSTSDTVNQSRCVGHIGSLSDAELPQEGEIHEAGHGCEVFAER